MNLVKATDKALAEYNREFLADPEAIREAQRLGDLWRKQLEEEGILPKMEEVTE
jgi:hypothetical protein